MPRLASATTGEPVLPSSFDVWIPAAILLLSLLSDLIAAISFPKVFLTTWRSLSSPFRNFLSLNDLLDPVDTRSRFSRPKTRILTALACLALIGWLGCIMFGISSNDREYTIRALVFSICWSYVALKIILTPPRTPPLMIIAFGISSALFSLLALGSDMQDGASRTAAVLNVFAMIIPTIFAWLAGTLPLKTYLPSSNVAGSNDTPSVKLTCPEDNVNLWDWSSFTFVQPILDLALKRTLNEEDVWSLSPFFKHKNLFTKFLEYRNKHPTRSLLRFLLASNSLDLILDVLLELWVAVAGFAPPYALKEILAALSVNTPEARSRAYFWALATFIVHLSFAQVDLFKGWYTRRCYERTRGQLFCILHYKALKRQDVSGRVEKDGEANSADLGKIVNLMQGDAYAVAQRFWEFSGIFSSPVRIAIALTFLYQILGWSGLSGVAIVLVLFAVEYPLARYNIWITANTLKAKDKRMNLVNELLQNIRFLKFYGWEYSWSHKAQDARESELKWRVKRNVVETAISFVWIWMPSATALMSFLCYTLVAGEKLTVAKAFTAIAVFSQLQGPMINLPGQIMAMIYAYISMQRIEQFLKEDEVPDWASTLSAPIQRPTGTGPTLNAFGGNGNGNGNGNGKMVEPSVGFSGATFEWQESSRKGGIGIAGPQTPKGFRLGPLDIDFPAGRLTIVSGPTGSGKSALLAALLGEMQCTAGSVKMDKSGHQVAYCGQNPWLEHATIKDNIVFGCPGIFDEERYEAILDACALRQDLSIFEANDLTEIGEKGITLSGGQRARIALARAMYSPARVILLDDPLAAVDMHTAQHLVNRCLSGSVAKGRTIILVTHHLTLCLPVASYVVEVEKGKIHYQGTVAELEANGLLAKVIEAEEEPFPEEAAPSEPQNQLDEGHVTPRPSSRNGRLIDAEARAEGQVTLKSYLTYIYAGGILPWSMTILIVIAMRGVELLNQVFLARWGEAYEDETPAFFITRAIALKYPWDNLPSPNTNVRPWLVVLLAISICGAFTTLLHIILGYYISIKSSRRLFNLLLQRLTRAPARFFDTTPIGRILNRFTSDMNTIDDALQGSARKTLSGILNFLISFGVILYVIPNFTPVAVFIAWLYVRIAPLYVNASRDLRRLESVSMSPTFAGFDELLRGIVHIRAFGVENRYQDRFYGRVDKFQSFDHVYWLVNGWLRWRYDCLGSVVVFTTSLFALWSGVADGSTAIVIVQAGIFAEANRQLINAAAQLELDFNSIERVVEYLEVPQEAPAIVEKCRAPAYWPSSSGELVVEDLVVQYAPHLPPVLHQISFTVKPAEKLGVVGRTGSGKSTLAMSLLRMVEATSGRIFIDGIDISTIGLEELRTRITIVSQDVSLFSGTIRSNLDPLGKSTDEECIQVLERCHLLPLLNHHSTKDEPTVLDKKVNHGSMSAGEKQLLALARATLRRTNVIIMDEATSQIDSNLDDQIQHTIREELSGTIVITIAHRLKTVMDYDRILVLDNGQIVEFDTPASLLRTRGGVFREMCRKSADWGLFLKMTGSKTEGSRVRSDRSPEGSG